ncbi:MAG: amino acid racemase [Treponema sp.]|jgi:aspartate racemase|nr:amino acid racemase [Treponema sp.]
METVRPLVGIIGGVGPSAGLDFMRNIFANTRAVKDQDHIDSVLISCPALIPDRTEFLLNEGKPGYENPAYGMFECAKRLYRTGARYISVACNTAHADHIFTPFRALVEDSLPGVIIINILETCASHAKETGAKRVGLLATRGTYKSRVYHEYFTAEAGFVLYEPDADAQGKIHAAIYSEDFGIKAHPDPVTAKAKTILKDEIARLAGQGAEALILGCTELPLAINPSDSPLPLLDPALLSARRLIRLSSPEKLIP